MRPIFILLSSVLVIWGCGTANEPTFKLTVSVSPTEGGSVTPSDGVFDKNEDVLVTATPSNGWSFSRWEGDWSGTSNPITLRMTKDYNIIGVFERRNYALTVTVEGQGTVTEKVVTAKTTDYPFETIVELVPIPAEGWSFKEWSGDITGTQNPARITVSGPKTVVAKFERKNYDLTVTVEGQGTVTETVVMAKTTAYPFETIVELTPVAAEGWVFKEWSGDLTGTQNPASITVSSNKSVTAKFERLNYDLTVEVVGQGSVTERVVTAKTTTYPFETIVELTPTAEEGWVFMEWSGDLTGSQSPARITLTGPKSVVANFKTTPTVTTDSITTISPSSSIVWSNIPFDGGDQVTSRGVCYSTDQNPTITGSCVVSGTGVGVFSASLTGLAMGSTYYLRSFATNSLGTAYGTQTSFTTSLFDIDGNIYPVVKIGDQYWMASNLSVSRYKDGTTIPNLVENVEWASSTTGAWAHNDNQLSIGLIYGKLYNWYAVSNPNGLCPANWHIPTNDDWTILSNFLGANAGIKMKAVSGWISGNGTNESGFNGLPAGARTATGSFVAVGNNGYFLSASEANLENTYRMFLSGLRSDLSGLTTGVSKKNGYSVRCLRD